MNDVLLDIFVKHSPKLVETNDIRICCLTSPDTVCKTEMVWYFSCEELFPNTGLKVSSWSVCNLTIVLNFISVVMHLVWRQRSPSNTILIVGLNVAEMLQGAYLYIIAGADVTYGDTFAIEQYHWRSSTVCLLASTLALDFSLSSAAAQILLSLSRLMIVIHPVDTDFKRSNFVAKHVGHLHFLGLCLSFAFSASLYFSHGSFPSSLCLITVDPTKFVLLCRLMTLFILCFHITVSILIKVMSFLLLKKYKESQKAISKSKSVSSASLSIKLYLTIISTTMCWIPPDIVFLTALFLPVYPTDMIIWTVVTVGQITAVLSPIMVGISLLKSVWRDSKIKHSNILAQQHNQKGP